MLRKRMKKKAVYGAKSMLESNVELAVDNILDYQHVVKPEPDFGYKGLKKIFENRQEVNLCMINDTEQSETITGIISHYDDAFKQLIIISDGSLKRIVFDQIADVQPLPEGEYHEKNTTK